MKKQILLSLYLAASFSALSCYTQTIYNRAPGKIFVGLYTALGNKVNEGIFEADTMQKLDVGGWCVTHLYIKGEADGPLAGLEYDYYLPAATECQSNGFTIMTNTQQGELVP